MLYAQAPAKYPYTPVKIVLLTGLSNPASCALSDCQLAFLASLEFPESWKVYRNFPWIPGVEEARLPSLWLAGLHNAWQFLLASTPLFRRMAAEHWEAMARTTEHLLVIAGSCGLQIVNCLLADRPVLPTRVDVLGLGPVAWRTPPVQHRFIQGDGDRLSRLFFRRVENRLAGAGHMKYLEHPRMKEMAERWISDSISR